MKGISQDLSEDGVARVRYSYFASKFMLQLQLMLFAQGLKA
jgi:hypothetical protein